MIHGQSSLDLCRENGLKSVAYPAISCGIFGYPPEEAAEVGIIKGRASGKRSQATYVRYQLLLIWSKESSHRDYWSPYSTLLPLFVRDRLQSIPCWNSVKGSNTSSSCSSDMCVSIEVFMCYVMLCYIFYTHFDILF